MPKEITLESSANLPTTNPACSAVVADHRGECELLTGWKAAARVGWFLLMTGLLLLALNAAINSGLRRVPTGEYGVSNRIMRGQINASLVITGSSRAVSHYDPRIIEEQTGQTAFNLGRNGSQTDMQLAVLKAYLEHNRRPRTIIHNLDAFSFVTTRTVYDMAQYVPYLSDDALYRPLHKIDANTWRSRYVPLYGYVVDDMNFAWMIGVKAFFGRYPKEDHYLGFDPREGTWTEDFERFRATNPHGVRWDVEPEGIHQLDELMRLCHDRGIRLILVYSPEYLAMQKLTANRGEIFQRFREMAAKYEQTFWDFSDWRYSGDTAYFNNSQHLNAKGAALFSKDLAVRLRDDATPAAALDPTATLAN